MSATPRLALVDYGMGNRRSVEKALEHVGAHVERTSDPRVIADADALVLPGVGAFPRAMSRLSELGLAELLRERVAAGVPLLGICLGMQLLFEGSSELGGAEGLGLLPGAVAPLEARGERMPHIGWTDVSWARPSPLTEELGARTAFYHVHSFAPRPAEPADVLGTATYGTDFASAVARGRVFGVQFHPEKSSRDGLALLRGFLRACAGAAPPVAAAGLTGSR